MKALIFLLLLNPLVWAQDNARFSLEDPAKIVAEEFSKTPCRECHVSEFEVWEKTGHARSFWELHRKAPAMEIAQKMGVSLIKRDSPCLKCHYTINDLEPPVRAISGVSCESCHGAALDWVQVHADYGTPGADPKLEMPEHREQRIQTSLDAGMRRGDDFYALALRCLECHSVPDAELVNRGGHSTGTRNFDFLEMSQGAIRHNFLQSFLEGDGRTNAEAEPDEQRRMFVLGRVAALEIALRNLAQSNQEVYGQAQLRFLRESRRKLQSVQDRLQLGHFQKMLTSTADVTVRTDKVTLLEKAKNIGDWAMALEKESLSADWSALDGLIQGTDSEAESAPETPIGPDPAHSTFATLGPGQCVSCHGDQNRWWISDPHGQSVDPFFEASERVQEITARYGLASQDWLRGDSPCMACHGSVITGREKREVQDGVGCESCHGPGSGYLDPHQEGEKGTGDRRSGYIAALTLGLHPLRQAETRAATCASCHYIQDEKLLASGHRSGEKFAIQTALDKIKHWPEPLDFTADAAAYTAISQAKGPVPQVEVADLPAPVSASLSTMPEPARNEAGPSPETAVGKLPGEVLSHVRPNPKHPVIGPDRCVSCHEPQAQWWGRDVHYRSLDPFFDQNEKNQKIAAKYGIEQRDWLRGTHVCMDCHGTVISGRESRNASQGVGCEACHGPGGDYLEPHQEGKKADGVPRPGFTQSLPLGLNPLQEIDARAEACMSCHKIPDARLVEAGHPDGLRFDFAAGVKQIRHWDNPLEDSAVLSATYARVSGISPEQAQASRAAAAVVPEVQTTTDTPVELNDLPPLDPNTDSATLLKQIQQRLERIRSAVQKRSQ
ncbi:MAG: hypothetical protein H6510_13080 [Acidobacteria bacterium]|nr:hypothetical protein [Acidobacteriota bacterium]